MSESFAACTLTSKPRRPHASARTPQPSPPPPPPPAASAPLPWPARAGDPRTCAATTAPAPAPAPPLPAPAPVSIPPRTVGSGKHFQASQGPFQSSRFASLPPPPSPPPSPHSPLSLRPSRPLPFPPPLSSQHRDPVLWPSIPSRLLPLDHLSSIPSRWTQCHTGWGLVGIWAGGWRCPIPSPYPRALSACLIRVLAPPRPPPRPPPSPTCTAALSAGRPASSSAISCPRRSHPLSGPCKPRHEAGRHGSGRGRRRCCGARGAARQLARRSHGAQSREDAVRRRGRSAPGPERPRSLRAGSRRRRDYGGRRGCMAAPSRGLIRPRPASVPKEPLERGPGPRDAAAASEMPGGPGPAAAVRAPPPARPGCVCCISSSERACVCVRGWACACVSALTRTVGERGPGDARLASAPARASLRARGGAPRSAAAGPPPRPRPAPPPPAAAAHECALPPRPAPPPRPTPPRLAAPPRVHSLAYLRLKRRENSERSGRERDRE